MKPVAKTVVAEKTMRIYSGTGHPELAAAIAHHLGTPLGEPNVRRFSNGEIHCRFDESVRGNDVFIIQTHCEPVNANIMEQLIM
ncbi:MAG: ribose-phosphate pyrophosphokinase-like domain-containing protein, partial [Acidimicrobiales bacterium]